MASFTITTRKVHPQGKDKSYVDIYIIRLPGTQGNDRRRQDWRRHIMRKPMKYALVAFISVAMLFSFTSCDDDDDNASIGLSDTEEVSIVATAFVDAITKGYNSSTNTGTYSIWDTNTTTGNMIIITTSDYIGYVTSSDSGYTVTTSPAGAYTVDIDDESCVVIMPGTSTTKVMVDIDAEINDYDSELKLIAYIEDDTVLTTGDYAPTLTINKIASDLTAGEISLLVSSLVDAVNQVMV